MIIMYNETTTPWKASKPNPNGTTRLSIGRKQDDTYKQISILVPTDSITPLGTDYLTNSDSLQIVCDASTSIYYGKKDNAPCIGTNGPNKDIFLISFDARNQYICDITFPAVFVFACLSVRGHISLILSIKEGCENFAITTYEPKTGLNHILNFDIAPGKEPIAERITISKRTEEASAPDHKYRVKIFRPARPTNLVFVRKVDEDDARGLLNEKGKNIFTQDNQIETYSSENELSELLKKYSAEGYRASTLFTTLNSATVNDFGEYTDEFSIIRSIMDVTNVVLGKCDPPRVIKR